MTAFNPGDRVRVSFDGAYGHHTDLGGVIVHAGDRSCYVRAEHLSPVPTPVLFADIKVGDRIRVVGKNTVLEATVKRIDSYLVTDWFGMSEADGWQFFRLTPPVPPEPEYVVGAVYLDAYQPEGVAYRRTADGRWRTFNGIPWAHDFPIRPLVRLVPEEPPAAPPAPADPRREAVLDAVANSDCHCAPGDPCGDWASAEHRHEAITKAVLTALDRLVPEEPK